MQNKRLLMCIRGIVPLVILCILVYEITYNSSLFSTPPSAPTTSFWTALAAPVFLGVITIFMTRLVMTPLFRLLLSLMAPILARSAARRAVEKTQNLPTPEEYTAIISQPMIFGQIALGMYMSTYPHAAWRIVEDGFLVLMFLSLARNMYLYGKTASL